MRIADLQSAYRRMQASQTPDSAAQDLARIQQAISSQQTRSSQDLARQYFQQRSQSVGQERYDLEFNVSPVAQQILIRDAQETNDLLNKISVIPVGANKNNIVKTLITNSITARNAGTVAQPNIPVDVSGTADRTYQTEFRNFNPITKWKDIDSWRHIGDWNAMYASMFTIRFAWEQCYILLRGKQRLPHTNLLENIDLGIPAILRAEKPANIIDHWVPGSKVIIIGKNRTINVSGAVIDLGGGKSKINAINHGIIIGGMFTIENTTNYNGKYELLATSTPDELHITKAFQAENLNNAVISQPSDFANLDLFANQLYKDIPEYRRMGVELWMAEDVLAAEENKLYGHMDLGTPSEKAFISQATKSYAGLVSSVITSMEPASFWITAPKNIQYITLLGSVRRKYVDAHDYYGFIDWNYFEACNQISDIDAIRIAENLRFRWN